MEIIAIKEWPVEALREYLPHRRLSTSRDAHQDEGNRYTSLGHDRRPRLTDWCSDRSRIVTTSGFIMPWAVKLMKTTSRGRENTGTGLGRGHPKECILQTITRCCLRTCARLRKVIKSTKQPSDGYEKQIYLSSMMRKPSGERAPPCLCIAYTQTRHRDRRETMPLRRRKQFAIDGDRP